MIRIIITLIEIIICYLLQSAVFSHLQLANVVPDLLMVLVVSCAFQKGIFHGMFTGFFAGLLTDLMTGNVVGVCALIYMGIGYLCGYSNKIYDDDDYTIPVLMFIAAEFLYCFTYYVFTFLLRGRLSVGYYMYRIGLARTVYTAVVGILLYMVLKVIHKGLIRIEQKEEF